MASHQRIAAHAVSSLLVGALAFFGCEQGVGAPADGETPDNGATDGGASGPDGDEGPVFGDAPPLPTQPIALETVAEGLVSPVAMAVPPDQSGRRFIVDRTGVIYVLDENDQLLDEPFLDIRDRVVDLIEEFDERGLLGLAFHPDYDENGRFFVYYSAPRREGTPEEYDHTAILAEYRVSDDDADRADPESERVLLEIPQPGLRHNGGTLAFGPDGYLYLGLGDGGQSADVGVGHPPLGNGQDTSTLLGSMLRLDVDGEEPYGIPPDNPLVDEPGRDEIFAYGFRNPYRFSFDEETGALLVGDVGEALYEEVDVVRAGENYGWNIREATHCFSPEMTTEPPETCPEVGPNGEPLVPPVIEYPHLIISDGEVVGLSVIGGHIYRGDAIPFLQGLYVFGDWSPIHDEPRGKLFVARPQDPADGLWEVSTLEIEGGPGAGELDGYLLAIGEDADGELYLLTSETTGPTGDTGRVQRIIAP